MLKSNTKKFRHNLLDYVASLTDGLNKNDIIQDIKNCACSTQVQWVESGSGKYVTTLYQCTLHYLETGSFGAIYYYDRRNALKTIFEESETESERYTDAQVDQKYNCYVASGLLEYLGVEQSEIVRCNYAWEV